MENNQETKLTNAEYKLGWFYIENCCKKYDKKSFDEFYNRFYALEKDEQKLMFCFISGAVMEIRKNSVLGTLDRLTEVLPNEST